MDLLMAGVNHRTAPVEVRERLALPPGRLPLVLAGLREGLRASGCVWLARIGPVTSEAARDYGLRVDVEARPYTAEGLVVALVEYFKRST